MPRFPWSRRSVPAQEETVYLKYPEPSSDAPQQPISPPFSVPIEAYPQESVPSTEDIPPAPELPEESTLCGFTPVLPPETDAPQTADRPREHLCDRLEALLYSNGKIQRSRIYADYLLDISQDDLFYAIDRLKKAGKIREYKEGNRFYLELTSQEQQELSRPSWWIAPARQIDLLRPFFPNTSFESKTQERSRRRGRDIPAASITLRGDSAVIVGDHGTYTTTLHSCTCVDFRQNKRAAAPCKHIYRLAAEILSKDDTVPGPPSPLPPTARQPTSNAIKEIRKYLKMTQSEFAKETGKTRDSISNLESGRSAPDDTFIKLVCRKFGISERWLRTGEGEMFSATAEEDAITAVLSSAIGHADTEQQRFIRAVAKIPPEYIPAVTQAALAYIKAMYPEALKDPSQDPPET